MRGGYSSSFIGVANAMGICRSVNVLCDASYCGIDFDGGVRMMVLRVACLIYAVEWESVGGKVEVKMKP